MNNDLIERLKAINPVLVLAEGFDGLHGKALKEAIAALSPVLPEDEEGFIVGDVRYVIERLRAIINSAKDRRFAAESYDIDTAKIAVEIINNQAQRIHELESPVLPEDVQVFCNNVREGIEQPSDCADLIERLARENGSKTEWNKTARESLEKQRQHIIELQARIKELDREHTKLVVSDEAKAAQIAEYKKLAQAVKEEIIHEDGALVEFYRNNKKLFSRQEGKFFRRAFDSKLLDGIMLKKKMK